MTEPWGNLFGFSSWKSRSFWREIPSEYGVCSPPGDLTLSLSTASSRHLWNYHLTAPTSLCCQLKNQPIYQFRKETLFLRKGWSCRMVPLTGWEAKPPTETVRRYFKGGKDEKWIHTNGLAKCTHWAGYRRSCGYSYRGQVLISNKETHMLHAFQVRFGVST